MAGLTRREFLEGAAAAAALAGCSRSGPRAVELAADVVAVRGGAGPAERVRTAVEGLGGIGLFVRPGMKVALLPNSQKENPGSFTHPEVVRQTIELARSAGAAAVRVLSWLPARNWEATGLDRTIREAGGELVLVPTREERSFRRVPIPAGGLLKEARLLVPFLESDCLITLPVVKHHVGNHFTGALKNCMGLNYFQSNRFFHERDDAGPAHLDQCIADLNLALKPALCIVDATEILLTNGPFGPGLTARPEAVVAGVDRVAVDAYCTRFLSRKPAEILMILKAHEHGLGEIDLSRLRVLEA